MTSRDLYVSSIITWSNLIMGSPVFDIWRSMFKLKLGHLPVRLSKKKIMKMENDVRKEERKNKEDNSSKKKKW